MMRALGILFSLSLAAVGLMSASLAAQQVFNNSHIESGAVIEEAAGKVSHIEGTAKVGKNTGDVSWITGQSEVGTVDGKVSWVTGNSRVGLVNGDVSWVTDDGRVDAVNGKVSWVKNNGRVGAVNGDVSWVIDNARVGFIKGKVSHVKNRARVGMVIGDVSWVTDEAYIGLVVGKSPQIMGRGRVGAVVNPQTCRRRHHWLCSWLGYGPASSEREPRIAHDQPAPPVAAAGKSKRSEPCGRVVMADADSRPQAVIPLDCQLVRKKVLPVLRQRPDLKSLLTAPPETAAGILGPPFNSYDLEETAVKFYGRQEVISIHFQDDRPTLILFDMAGAVPLKSAAAWLGFESLPPPVFERAINSLIWFDSGNNCIIQVKLPEYKLDGQYVYPVLIHLPGEQTVDRLKKEYDALSRAGGSEK